MWFSTVGTLNFPARNTPSFLGTTGQAPPRGASVDCIESKDYGSCSGVGCDNGTTSRAQSPQPPQLLPVAFELLPPYSPSVPDGERHKYDSVRVLLEEYFVPQRKIVSGMHMWDRGEAACAWTRPSAGTV